MWLAPIGCPIQVHHAGSKLLPFSPTSLSEWAGWLRDNRSTTAPRPLFVLLWFKTEICLSRALLGRQSGNKWCVLNTLLLHRETCCRPSLASPEYVKFHAIIVLIPFTNEQVFCVCVAWSEDSNHAVCQLLMVQSCGGPGHLRLLPDNEYDEDG